MARLRARLADEAIAVDLLPGGEVHIAPDLVQRVKDGRAPTLSAVLQKFNPDDRHGWGGKGDFGTGRYTADNPPYGAVFAYYLPEDLQSMKEQRREEEKGRASEGEDNPYPSWDQLRREDREEEPSITLTVRDAGGNVVRRIDGPAGKGFHRVAWDMRYPAPDPVNLSPPTDLPPWQSDPVGPMVLPGTYSVSLARRVEGRLEDLGHGREFALKPLFTGGLVAEDRAAVLEFQAQTADLYRAVMGADKAAGEIEERIEHLLQALQDTPSASEAMADQVRQLRARMQDLRVTLNGDSTISSRSEPVPMALATRIGILAGGTWGSQSAVTGNHRDSFEVAAGQVPTVLAELKGIAADLAELEAELEAAGAPWTPSRLPDWPTGAER